MVEEQQRDGVEADGDGGGADVGVVGQIDRVTVEAVAPELASSVLVDQAVVAERDREVVQAVGAAVGRTNVDVQAGGADVGQVVLLFVLQVELVSAVQPEPELEPDGGAAAGASRSGAGRAMAVSGGVRALACPIRWAKGRRPSAVQRRSERGGSAAGVVCPAAWRGGA